MTDGHPPVPCCAWQACAALRVAWCAGCRCRHRSRHRAPTRPPSHVLPKFYWCFPCNTFRLLYNAHGTYPALAALVWRRRARPLHALMSARIPLIPAPTRSSPCHQTDGGAFHRSLCPYYQVHFLSSCAHTSDGSQAWRCAHRCVATSWWHAMPVLLRRHSVVRRRAPDAWHRATMCAKTPQKCTVVLARGIPLFSCARAPRPQPHRRFSPLLSGCAPLGRLLLPPGMSHSCEVTMVPLRQR